jgi:hypothetical protein
MSNKYIAQVNSDNFVYPNNTLAEYDVDIVHDINNNSVSGTTSGFSAVYNSGTGNIQVSFTYIWNKNGADPYIDESNLLHVLSVHMTEPTKEYYKPWRMVSGVTTSTITATTKTDTFTFIVTPSMMGVSSFSNGVYNFEIRFIGKRAIYPLCYTTSIILPSPTPTPTNTPTRTPGLTTTPTPTPTLTPSSGGGGSSYWTVSNYDCGGGTLNDVGINSSFMSTLEGPSTFPLTSGLYGNKTSPSGILYGTGFTNTIQFNVTTGIAGVGNCAVVRIEINSGARVYETYFTTNPFPQITGVVINPLDTVTAYVECYVGPCP